MPFLSWSSREQRKATLQISPQANAYAMSIVTVWSQSGIHWVALHLHTVSLISTSCLLNRTAVPIAAGHSTRSGWHCLSTVHHAGIYILIIVRYVLYVCLHTSCWLYKFYSMYVCVVICSLLKISITHCNRHRQGTDTLQCTTLGQTAQISTIPMSSTTVYRGTRTQWQKEVHPKASH